MMGRYDRTLAERFHEKYVMEPNTGCWLWIVSTRLRGLPYGEIRVGKRMASAHRVSWELHNGSIPNEMWVLHKCDVPQCVNPAHLFLGTRTDNARDMVKKGRSHSQKKTHCPKGHAYTEDNLMTYPGNIQRNCRACKTKQSYDDYRKNKAKKNADSRARYLKNKDRDLFRAKLKRVKRAIERFEAI
jgi:hypothetical protein